MDIKMKKNRRNAQITVFVIIALAIVALAILAFALYKRAPGNMNAVQDPNTYMTECLTPLFGEIERKILEGNGYLNRTDNYILYSGNKNGEKVPYLCSTLRFYFPCVPQEPMFAEHIRKELKTQMKDDINSCLLKLKKAASRGGYSASTAQNVSFEIDMTNEKVILNIYAWLKIEKEGEKKIYDSFVIDIKSPIYKLADTVRNIVNYESALCEFNAIGWMMNHRDLNIKRFVASDQTKIYTVIDRATGKKLSFAVKTCAMPAGL